MKIGIVLFGLLAWIGCSEESDLIRADVLETDAVWMNMLATDGCDWHFAVTAKDTSYSLAADDNSIKKIEDAVGKIEGVYSFTDIHMKYVLTGKKKNVKCGWGKTADFDEISVLEISKK